MILSIISFTENGIRLSRQIEALAGEFPEYTEIQVYTKWGGAKENSEYPPYVTCRCGEWAGKQMEERNALLFIGACGIAVRAIAPYVDNKLYDSPVLVMDELGTYVIPLLSGHMGGANELAEVLAEKLSALPVITTATDLNHKFSVDIFAKKNNLAVMNKDGIAKVSSKVLRGEDIKMSIENYPPQTPVDIVITSNAQKVENKAFDASLILMPKIYVIGMGCRKRKEPEKIEEFIKETLLESKIPEEQVFALASIDVKREEDGFLSWTRKRKLPFLTYSADELTQVPGDFTPSAFVKSQVGVDNVCERAALCASGEGGKLILRKQAKDGMTIAVAKKTWSVNINEK